MKDLLTYLIEMLKSLGYSGIVALLAAISAGVGLIIKLGAKLYKLRQQRRLNRDLHPFYDGIEIQHATQYYVETKCQNIAPSKDEELGRTHAFAPKEDIIPFFLNKAFNPHKDESQFYIVLADSGMGKTTFLINLYLRYHEQFFGASYQMKLFPLGFPDVDTYIEKMPDTEKKNTILLLDAFDEDINAVRDYKTRLNKLIQKVLGFREVVITCRTQFFPSEEEEPKETGVLRFGGAGGERIFRKLYLSPFDKKDIQVYLRKRFSWLQQAKRAKAQKIVESCPNLMVRPMLLSYIEDLLKREQPYNTTYEVYAELIDRWIERETYKVPTDRRKHYMEELYQFSREIAVDLYRNREQRQGRLLISGAEIQPFADKHGVTLSEMEMKSRSLLNRNALGEYKFSHKSVLEYFLAEEAFFNPEFREEFKFEGMEQAEAFFDEMIWGKLTVPFFNRSDLNGEYSVKDGKTRVLTKLPEKILSEITMLKLQEWKEEDEVLLLRGLKNLERLGLTEEPLSSKQKNVLKHFLPKCEVFQSLRNKPLMVSENEPKKVFELHDNRQPLEYIRNDYEDKGEIVLDHATGLIWQKAGSPNFMNYQDAQKYVKKLNRERFAGYDDWRLPTIPELMSLLEPKKQSNGLYIDPIFNENQRWCWSCDKRSSESAWGAIFYNGIVDWYNVDDGYYVRVVHARQC